MNRKEIIEQLGATNEKLDNLISTIELLRIATEKLAPIEAAMNKSEIDPLSDIPSGLSHIKDCCLSLQSKYTGIYCDLKFPKYDFNTPCPKRGKHSDGK